MISNFLLAGLLACDPALAALFTPPHPQLGRFDVCTTAEPIERSTPEGLHASPLRQMETLDAFGAAGAYDRAKLAELFGGRRVSVVRGWRSTGNRFESVTLLSPFPNPSLTRLEPGTMIITWRVGSSESGQVPPFMVSRP